MDPALGDFAPGDILIEDALIARVGPGLDPPPAQRSLRPGT